MKNLATALVKAQKAFGPALKTSTNPHFRSKYADLSNCIEAVIGALNDNGIGLMQRTYESKDGVMVETIFIHESGETLECGVLHVPASKQDPQGYGSALTYARRYSLMAVCGIAPEDDDGNAASKPKKPMQIPANTAGQDYLEKCNEQERALILDYAMEIESDDDEEAFFTYTKAKAELDTDQQAALWSKVSSKKRSAIKKIGQAKTIATWL
jgi:hypothetical protein